MLHNLGYLSLGYIDDSYLQGDTSSECLGNVKVTTSLFKKVGFHLHPAKSVILSTQRLTFLGFVLDSNDKTVTPAESKIQKVVTACQHLLTKHNPTITEVAEVIGLLVSNLPGAQYGPLHYRSLESDKIQALKINKGNYKSHIQLTSSSIAELQWWIANMPTVQRDIVRPNLSMVIQTDASKKGWGAALGKQEIGVRWTDVETPNHINILKAFCHTTNNTHVQLQIDNTTAVAYITNMGSSKSTQLNNLAKEMWTWCINKNIWLSAGHIAGKLNTSADNKSHNFSHKHEWALSKNTFTRSFQCILSLTLICLSAGLITNQMFIAPGNQTQGAPMLMPFP